MLGWLGWRRSTEALNETRRAPVRDAQHALLETISSWADELPELYEAINFDVQQDRGDPEKLESEASALRSIVRQMTDPVVVDEQLASHLTQLRGIAISADPLDAPQGLAERLDQFAKLVGEINESRNRPGDATGIRDTLIELGKRHAGLMEPLRQRNSEAIDCTRAIQSRLREISRDGLGNFASAAELQKRSRHIKTHLD